jgi:hypothetical protein
VGGGGRTKEMLRMVMMERREIEDGRKETTRQKGKEEK